MRYLRSARGLSNLRSARGLSMVVVGGILALTVGACGQSASGSGSSTSSSSVGVTKSSVTFGQTVPFSGPAALYGESAAGVKAYFAMVNAQGGVGGRKLKLIALDDQYLPPVAVSQTRKLISQELAEVAVNGSATTKAVLNILDPLGVPVIGPQTGATYLFQNTPSNVFNVWPHYTIEGKLLGGYAQKLGLKKVGVLYQNDDFGQSLYAGVLQSGLKPAKVITYDPSQTDFSPDAQEMKSAGVDGVIILAIPKPTISFLNDMAALNFKPVRLMSQVSAIPQSFSAAPQEFPGSYVGAFIPPLQDTSNPQVSQFMSAMRQYEPGAPASIFAAWGWTEAQVAVAGLKNVTGKLTRASYVKGLDSISNLQTLGGSLSYSSTSHVGLTHMFMVQARGGQLAPIG